MELQNQHFKEYGYGRVYCYGHIKLEGPYSDLFLYGILRLHKSSSRRTVLLYNPVIKESLFIPYSRYLYTVITNSMIPEGYEVDHIDNDFSNDDPSNLQLLTPEENYEKYRKYYTDKVQQNYYIELTCNNCKKQFSKQKKRVEKENFSNQYCCKQCETEYRNRDKIEINCATCKQPFLINKQTYTHYKSRNQQNFWCSEECKLKFKERALLNFVSKELLEYLIINAGRLYTAKYFNINKTTVRDWKIKLGLDNDVMTVQRPNKLKTLREKTFLVQKQIPDKQIIFDLLKDNFTIADIADYIKVNKDTLEKKVIEYVSSESTGYNARLINAFFLEGYNIKEVANKLDVETISVKLTIQKYNIECLGDKIRPPLLELREMFLNGNSVKSIALLFGVSDEEVLKWINKEPQAIVK